MKQGITVAVLALALATAGCVSMGPNYDPAAVAQLTPGMDKAQVIAVLGHPTTTVTSTDGSQTMMWTHATGSMLGSDARSVMLMFGADGKYVKMMSQAETRVR
jgi:hypothetical protein